MDFKNSKILVTGATGYIGGVIAEKLSIAGAKVVITGRDEEKLNNLYVKLSGSGHEKYAADLFKHNEIEDMINKTLKSDQYTGVVHCAALVNYSPLRTLTIDMLADAMQINFFAFVEIIKIISKKKYFNKMGGSIVALSSVAADLGEPCQTAYSAAKAALDASIRTLSFELAPKNIRINSIRAGVIKDNPGKNYMVLQSIGNDNSDKYETKQLLGAGTPEDVANVVSFLLSDDSRMITGRYIYADGGRFL